MRTLRVVLDQLVAPVPGGIGRYAENLVRELAAVDGGRWRIEGLLPAVSEAAAARVGMRLPELDGIRRLAAPRRVLAETWRRGIVGTLPGQGADAVFAPSLFAPLVGRGAPTVVTIHDAVPWSCPETLTPRGAAWHRALGERAAKHAAAITAPTAAVARQLEEVLGLSSPVHVVPGAPSPELGRAVPAAMEVVADRHRLPSRFILAVGTLEPRKRLSALVRALGEEPLRDATLVIAGPSGWGGVHLSELASEAGVGADRVRPLGFVSDTDLAALYQLADAFVMPSRDEGFGLPLVEAMRLGCPVVHSDAPALVEVAGGAGVEVAQERDGEPESAFVGRLAAAIAGLLGDAEAREACAERGRARAEDFSWRASAEAMWRVIDAAA
ncbi:D-inositol 3-phosphate glycosyltransferase [Pseudoclavibacter triregionum]|nr:D-inositol 3-phosphate glycosyltransferase [Pseudoclavibacter triregionum]